MAVKQERPVKAEKGKSAPSQNYRDIPLFSMDTRGAITHLMKFAHHNRVDPNNTSQFVPPVKLNRKTALREKQRAAQPGDPVIDKWGKPVLTTEGRPLTWPGTAMELEAVRPYLSFDKDEDGDEAIAPGSGHVPRGRLFKKRVREVFKSANAARRTSNEEFYPWVLEDFETSNDWESARLPAPNSIEALESLYLSERERRERLAAAGVDDPGAPLIKTEAKAEEGSSASMHAPWIGQLEGDSDENSSAHHVLFAFDERNAGGFKVIPVRRLYKFMQLQKHAIDGDEVEEEFQRYQRSSDMERWSMRSKHHTGAGARSEGSARNIMQRLPSLNLPNAGGQGWGGSRLVAVRGTGGDQEGEDTFASRIPKQETTYDEIDFEESFADDEEPSGAQLNDDDPEAKELEERLKREMVADHIDEDNTQIKPDPDEDVDMAAVNRRSGADDLFGDTLQYGRHDDAVLTGTGRQMRKIMKALSQRDGNDVYDSDEEAKNPYASESEEEEQLDVLHPERAILEAREARAREEKQARESTDPHSTPDISSVRSQSPEGSGMKRKSDVQKRDVHDANKRAKLHSPNSSRGGSPPRSLTPLETEIIELIRQGKTVGTADLVQHFRQRLKQEPSLKEQLTTL
ncbi:hypothetical protein MVES_001542 [Malassezia vespertilionis]|uniref:Uncharacterized protein n=1 Tax=Malassezia vespertilionis TaxID=2020962 RepID=A0A2N1JCF5_9BASI|nr:hypothetical protein MVES_001542 [Malassezia vespertilionis]